MSRSFAVYDVHHAEAGEHYAEGTVFGGNRFRSPFEKREIAETHARGAAPRESEHFRADIHANDTATRSHNRGGSLRDSACTRAEVEHLVAAEERGAADQSIDDRYKSPVDLSNVDVRDAVQMPFCHARASRSCFVSITRRPSS